MQGTQSAGYRQVYTHGACRKKDEVTFLSSPEPGHIVLGRDLRRSIPKTIDRCLAGNNVPLFTRAWAAVGMATPMHHAQTARENLKI
jgi:hypothetical protein